MDHSKSPPCRLSSWRFWAPPLAALAAFVLLPTAQLDTAGRACIAVVIWTAGWWFSEALPLGATSLLPLVLLPLLNITTLSSTAANYADKIVFLFLGAFMIANAMQKCGLHQRLALHTVRLLGDRPAMLVGGFMITAAFLSMWISNTAVALMLLPVGVSVIQATGEESSTHRALHRRFASCLVLGIAYATSIGGLATIIGTPPNTMLVGFMEREYGTPLSFAAWLRFGLPVSLTLLPIFWWILVRPAFRLGQSPLPGAAAFLQHSLVQLGRWSKAERRVLAIFVFTALLWSLRPFLSQLAPLSFLQRLDDTWIALLGALALFAASNGAGERLLDWRSAVKIPWEILLLFGAGLSLAAALQQTGVANFVGSQFTGLTIPTWLLVLTVTTVIVFFGELASNTATVATFLPILGSVAQGLHLTPQQLLVPATLAASLSFMLPVGTPPNALAYATGYVNIRQMTRVGFLLNLIAILGVTILATLSLNCA